MATHYKYSIEELENMLPFEREIYTALLEQFIKEKAEATKQAQSGAGGVYYSRTTEPE